MDHDQEFHHQLPSPPANPRPFVYRAAQPDSGRPHPLRRSSDAPYPFQGIAGELVPNALLLKFRVYMKLN
jgi:hypothetical protein